MKKIGIIGSGVVGSAKGKGFHNLGHDVLFYDIVKQRLLTLKEEGYQIVSSVKDIIDNTDISFVCVILLITVMVSRIYHNSCLFFMILKMRFRG